jgi:type IV pilus assembly protein PilM
MKSDEHRGASSVPTALCRGPAGLVKLARRRPANSLAAVAPPAPVQQRSRRSLRSLWPAPRTPIGIDIGGRYVKAVQLTTGRSNQHERRWQLAAAADFVRQTQTAALGAAEVVRIAEVLRRRAFRGNQVVLAVPDDKLVVGTMELPPRTAGVSLDAAARMEFSRAYKCEPKGFEMAYWDLPTAARAAKTTNVMAVACPHGDAETLIDVFASAGLDVVALDARPCAMARACAAQADDAGGIVLLLEIGWNGAALVVLHRGVIVYERAVAEAGLRQLHDELAAALHVGPEVADAILTDPAVFGGDPGDRGAKSLIPPEVLGEVRGIVSAHFEQTARELMASVSYSSHQYPDAAVSRLLLLGGGALLPGLSGYMQERLGFECRVATAQLQDYDGDAGGPECSPAMTTAAGLAQLKES